MAWREVPGWFGYQRVYDAMVAEASGDFAAGSVFVELGAALGRSACYMAERILVTGKDIRFYTVDDWSNSGRFASFSYFAQHIERHGGYWEAFEAYRRTSGVGHLIHPIRGDIGEVASSFADSSVDFVFLDADHSYDNTLRFLAAWLPKLKKGGVFGGDNYHAGSDKGLAGAIDEKLRGRVVDGRSYVWRKP